MKNFINCCKIKKNTKKCIRKDNKIFNLPRKFTYKQCKNPRGFTMKASCAPFKFCKTNKYNGGKREKTKKIQKKIQFLYNPNDPKRSFDVYIDKNPNDTIHIKYKSLDDVKKTIKKLEMLYNNKKYSHKRIWQVAMIMYVRLKVLQKIKPQQFKLSSKYFNFLKKRTKLKTFFERKSLKFIY